MIGFDSFSTLMNHNIEPDSLKKQLEDISQKVLSLPPQHQGQIDELLLILRTLEQLHRDIRQQWFEPALPKTRQDLYHLLREIEETGGWPYIERMKLQSILRYLLDSETSVNTTE
jgi:hypothetical protein